MPDLSMILTAGAAVFAAIFLLALMFTRDVERAARAVTQNVIGTALGVITVAGAVVLEGIALISEVPALVITAFGVGAIIAGINWEVFLSVSVIGYIVMAGVWGE